MTGSMLSEVLMTLAAFTLLAVAVAAFAVAIHWSWVAKERLLTRLAARMGVRYETRKPWWLR